VSPQILCDILRLRRAIALNVHVAPSVRSTCILRLLSPSNTIHEPQGGAIEGASLPTAGPLSLVQVDFNERKVRLLARDSLRHRAPMFSAFRRGGAAGGGRRAAGGGAVWACVTERQGDRVVGPRHTRKAYTCKAYS